MRQCLTMAAIAVLLVSGFAETRWMRNGFTGGGAKSTCDAANIKGHVGCVRGWDNVKTGIEYQVTDAHLGGQWADGVAQSQPTLATAPTQIVKDTHYHHYSKQTGTGSAYATVRAHAIQTPDNVGLTWQLNQNDPSWWWTPSVTYTDGGITIDVKNLLTGSWDSSSWSDTHHDSGLTYASQNTGHGPAPMGTTSGDGEIRKATALPVGPNGSSIRVGFKWNVTGGATVDNASVFDWEEVIWYTAMSELTDADPDVDFDLEDLIP